MFLKMFTFLSAFSNIPGVNYSKNISLSILYALTWQRMRFVKIGLSPRIRNFLTHNNRRTRISRCFGRENEENVARTISCCGWPSFPRSRLFQSFLLFKGGTFTVQLKLKKQVRKNETLETTVRNRRLQRRLYGI